jgi:hypothetical protein
MARTSFSGPVFSANGFEGPFTATQVQFQSDNANVITMDAPAALAASYTFILPPNDGNSGQVLTTDGSGVTTWTTNGVGTVTSVGGTGTVNGLSLSGSVTSTGSLTLGGTLDLSAPPAIGSGTAATGAFTFLTSTTTSSTAAEATATRGVFSQLTLSGSFGSSNPIAPSSGQGVQGRVSGSNLTSNSTYYSGSLGQYRITGTNASTFPKVGMLGVVGDQTTTADAAVMAWMDGDGGTTTARAGYGIGMTQSTGASGFDYGMDLKLQDAVGGGASVQPYKVAEIRLANDGSNNPVVIKVGDFTDGTAATGYGKGSIGIDSTDGKLFVVDSSGDWQEIALV